MGLRDAGEPRHTRFRCWGLMAGAIQPFLSPCGPPLSPAALLHHQHGTRHVWNQQFPCAWPHPARGEELLGRPGLAKALRWVSALSGGNPASWDAFHDFSCFYMFFTASLLHGGSPVRGRRGGAPRSCGLFGSDPCGLAGAEPKRGKIGEKPAAKIGKKKSGKSSRAWAGGWLRLGEPRPAAGRGAASLWW